MNERIKQIRKNSDCKTLEKFGKRLGISSAAVSLIESGKNVPSTQTVKSICREFNVNEHWLRTGEGEMFVQKNENDEVMEFFEKMKLDADDSLKRRLVTALAQLDAEDWFYLEKVTQKLIDKRNKQNDDD